MKTSTITFVFLLIAFFSIPSSVQAQIVKPDTLSNWKKKFVFNLNVNQAAFSSNWKGGGCQFPWLKWTAQLYRLTTVKIEIAGTMKSACSMASLTTRDKDFVKQLIVFFWIRNMDIS